jgi:isoleucyl-tRNA synthetase
MSEKKSKESEYRKTVLTPQTEFPMRANLAKREPERLAKWESTKLYQQIQEKRKDRPSYILHDGPPYANGDIHLGHALNKILKDIVVRYKTMKGFRTPYVPGWDCHGLPIEQQILKKVGPKIHEMDPVDVRRMCHEYAAGYVDTQRAQFKRLGVTGDWERPYETFDPVYEAGILKVLRDLVARGLVRKGMKSVHWDTVFRTALAEAEIEYHTHESDSIYVAFPLRDAERYEATKGLTHSALVIWTTTPWTMPANLGVCLHPEFEYVALRHGGRDLIVAKELAGAFAKACGIENPEAVRTFRAGGLDRATCEHPIFPGKTSLVMMGRHVTLEAGTGCVHTAPGHGHDDFVIGAQYGLPVFVPVDDAGRYTADYPEMQGVEVFEANPKIVEKLRASGHLIAAKKVKHEYPYSWRSHKPIIFRATEQWFMEFEGDIREKALHAIDHDVKWIPKWGRDRIHAMVSTRPDWCLSRQRSWGVPIPSIRSKRTGESILDVRILERFIEQVAQKGTDAWFTEPLESIWPEGFVYEPTGENRPEDFEKERDILDVWFDSGASHVAVLEQDERLSSPADLYLEGSDQHRGWFQSALLTSIGVRDRAPFRTVLTHGFLLDGEGKAMSKSLGNVIPPQKIIEGRGADILRLWVCSEDYRSDMAASEEIFNRVSEAYRRIRNTMRFLLGNLYDFKLDTHGLAHADLEEADRWILGRLAELIDRVDKAFDAFEFHRVYHLIYGFCNTQLSAVYLDVLKDRLYCSAPEDKTRRAAQTTVHHLLESLTGMLAPLMVFTADEVWEYHRGGASSVHLELFPEARAEWRDAELAEKWERLGELREEATLALEEHRRVKTIGHSLDAEVEIRAKDPAEARFLSENLALLKELFIVSDVRIAEADGSDSSRPRIKVAASTQSKCERCWMRSPDIGQDPEHVGLCQRCSGVLKRLTA